MTSARGRLQPPGENPAGEHARRGAQRKPADAGAPVPAGALGGPTAAVARAGRGEPRLARLARLADPGTGRAREAHLLHLQRAYGNAAVLGHLQRVRAPAVGVADPDARTPVAAGHPIEARRSGPGGREAVTPDLVAAPAAVTGDRGTPAPTGPAQIQRWKDDGHVLTTETAAEAVFPEVAPFFRRIGAKRDAFIAALGKASLRMDEVVPHLTDRFMPGSGAKGQTTFYGFVGTLVASGVGDKLGVTPRQGQTRRGIKGEGPDHGEAGYYDIPRASAIAGNVARTDKYVNEAVQAYVQGDFKTMLQKLGDACHVAADRGSHAEGGIGEGHDTRMPDTSQGEHGTNLGPPPPLAYMENWADNDIVGLNVPGYKYGLSCTMQVIAQFFDRVRPLAMDVSGLRPAPNIHDAL